MYSFRNDYSEGAHPKILDVLIKTNNEQTIGYSEDEYTKQAHQLIKQKIQNENADVHIVVGGTQANLICISAFLRVHEACISVDTGHINVHETGAIEATGHKVISVKSEDGKLYVEDIEKVLEEHSDEHMVKPKLVYISNPTEVGSIYSTKELKALYECTKKHNLYLYVDGARFASALAVKENSMDYKDLAKYSDAFYLGGTKCGALFGEAIVITNEHLKSDFRYIIKQHGGLLAKGRLLGLQFKVLFEDDLYYQIGLHSNQMADMLKEAFSNLGYSFLTYSPTNQLFPILPNDLIKKLSINYDFMIMNKVDDHHSCVRFVTSFATKQNEVEKFIEELNLLHK